MKFETFPDIKSDEAVFVRSKSLIIKKPTSLLETKEK